MQANSRITGRSEPRGLRHGLAPLELVLSLPLILFVMALIINFGVLACWKVRAATVARQAVWRQRFDRKGQTDPLPTGWPNVQPPSDTVPAANPPSTSEGAPLFQDPFPPQQYPVGPAPDSPLDRGPLAQAAKGCLPRLSQECRNQNSSARQRASPTDPRDGRCRPQSCGLRVGRGSLALGHRVVRWISHGSHRSADSVTAHCPTTLPIRWCQLDQSSQYAHSCAGRRR